MRVSQGSIGTTEKNKALQWVALCWAAMQAPGPTAHLWGVMEKSDALRYFECMSAYAGTQRMKDSLNMCIRNRE